MAEGKTVDLLDVDIEKYDAAFSIRGSVTVTPTAFFERIELPEHLRYSFDILPLNPLDRADIVELNGKANEVYRKALSEAFDMPAEDVFTKKITPLTEKVANATDEDVTELEAELASCYSKVNVAWSKGENTRSVSKKIEIVTRYTEATEKLLFKEKGKAKQYTGEVDADVVNVLNPDVRNWLYDEIVRISQLTESERMGL